MSTTVAEIYTATCIALLEDGGLVLGTVTSAQFLTYLEEAVLDFCQQSQLVKKVYTQKITSGTSQYSVPVDILQVQAAFVGGKYIQPTSLEELQNSEYEWANKTGSVQQWFQDGLPADTLQTYPIPDVSGTVISGTYNTFNPSANGLTTVGPAGPTTNTLTLLGNIPAEVPDSFTPYLTYRVLYRIFSTDGECQDQQRAIYCDARWKEGVGLAQSIVGEILLEKGTR